MGHHAEQPFQDFDNEEFRDYRSQHAENSEAFLKRLEHPRGVNLVEFMQRQGHIGKLNPEWCEWFMGFPKGWTELKNWETLLSRKSRLKSSKQSKP